MARCRSTLVPLVSSRTFTGTLRWSLFHVLSYGPIPQNIAFILDGNRRYAKKKNISELEGYRKGYDAIVRMLRYCYEMGLKYMTAYIFSIDNFHRKPKEVGLLMDLLIEKINDLLNDLSILNKLGVKFRFVGKLELLEKHVKDAIDEITLATAKNNEINILVCIAYTSTNEIARSIQNSCREKLTRSHGQMGECSITLRDLESHMDFSGIPDPDVVIRTSGETRLSNFMLWQTSRSILCAPSCLWPEISLWHLVWAVLKYQRAHHYLEDIAEQISTVQHKTS